MRHNIPRNLGVHAELGDALKDIFDKRRMPTGIYTQAMLAERLSISPCVVTNWFKGHTRPRPDEVREMCRVLDYSVSDARDTYKSIDDLFKLFTRDI